MRLIVENGGVTEREAVLERALAQELRLTEELHAALLRQRAGVAADDVEAIEASVHALGRTLLTLEEARRRRSDIVRLMTDEAGDTLADLEAATGPLSPALAARRAALAAAAVQVSQEVRINQHILRRALEVGDAFLQQLFAGAVEPTPVYRPDARPPEREAAGVLLDRTA